MICLLTHHTQCQFLTTRKIIKRSRKKLYRILTYKSMKKKDEEKASKKAATWCVFLLKLFATCDAPRYAPTFLELAPRRYCVYQWVCERDTHAARAWHRCASTENEKACCYSSSSWSCRWNCRLVAWDRSFDFIREPSNINWRRLESNCRRVVLRRDLFYGRHIGTGAPLLSVAT